jgi:hypothetical protein
LLLAPHQYHLELLLLLLLLLLLVVELHSQEAHRWLSALPAAAAVQVLLHPAATAAALLCLSLAQSQTHPAAAAAAGL